MVKKADPVSFWRKQYEIAGNDVATWIRKADGLFTAANVLDSFSGGIHEEIARMEQMRYLTEIENQRLSVDGVSPMLLAMATECYLKALWLKQGNRLAKSGSYSKVLNGSEHQLDKLAGAVSRTGAVTFDAKELALLKFVSNWIVVGRYPIPRNFQQLSILDKNEHGHSVQRTEWISEPVGQLRKLIQRLQYELGGQSSEAP